MGRRLLVIIFIITVIIGGYLYFSRSTLTQAQTSSSDWPQLAHDSFRSGYTAHTGPSSPYTVKWRFHATPNPTSMSGRVQPVIAEGVACVGYYDGKLYCLDATTGSKKWEYQTGGPILNSAAIVGGKVFVGSQDGYVYAVNVSNGQLAWRYKTNKSIQNAPCIANDTVYIGSGDGSLYALTTSGSLKWKYDSGAPILQSAACGANKVYFGNEAVYAIALSDNGSSAGQLWKKRLQGQSFSGYWPVVAPSQSVVYFRTQPFDPFHTVLGDGDSVVNAGPAEKTTANITAEQDRIINHLNNERLKWKTFWALDTTTGNEKYTVPVLYTAGEGTTPTPPVVDDATGRGWVVWRTRYSTFFTLGVRCCVDVGKLNLATGRISHFNQPRAAYLHIIGDESSIISANAAGVFFVSADLVTGINHQSELSYEVSTGEVDWEGTTAPLIDGTTWKSADFYGGGGTAGGYVVPPAIANNMLYYNGVQGIIGAIE